MSSPVGDVALPERELPPAAFGPPFWFSYTANTLMMVAVSTLFVYADFVRSLGGTDQQLGRIVGIGMIGSIIMRFVQGVGIDKIGARHIWLWSTAGFIVCCLLHLTVTRIDGPGIYLLRIGYQSCLAGFFGASIAYISGRAPIARLAEVIGTLGTSGFVGMMLGTALGQFLIGDGPPSREPIQRLFYSSALMASLAFCCAFMATRGQVRKTGTQRHPPLWWLIRRYNPGLILLMSVATGMGLNLPTVFLRPYMLDLGVPDGVAFFFNVYPPIAFITRLTLRRVPDKFGIRPMIAVGFGAAIIGTMLFLVSTSLWLLLLPALFLGVAHASLFPAVVAGASGAFPGRYRGIGTTLVLAMFDVGVLLGSPLAGELLGFADRHGWPKYPTMFTAISALLTLCGIVYFTFSRATPTRRGL